MKFLSHLFDQGLKYRSIGIARSALSVFLKICSNLDINKFEEISRFMKGVFNTRPALPRLTHTWDVGTVLKYLESMPDQLTLLQLSCKLCMLFLLLSAQRCQTLHLIEISDIKFINDQVFIAPSHVLKQTRPGHHIDTIVFDKYPKNGKLCIVSILSNYLKRTKDLRCGNRLLISTLKPYKAVSQSTISRWVKLVMVKAGIDMTFRPHSTRSASTSKAGLQGIPLNCIMKTAGWSNARVFATFYNKPIKKKATIQEAVLSVE